MHGSILLETTHFLGFATFSFLEVYFPPRAPDQLSWTFFWVYWEKDNGCHNVVKTWTINLKLKTKKKNSLKNASLIEHFMRTLDWISVSLFISEPLHSFSYKNLSLFKAKLKKIKSFQVGIIRTFISNFKTSPLNTGFNFDKLFLSYHSLTNSCIVP